MNIYLNLIRAALAAEFKGEISSHIAFVPTSVNHAANRDVEAPLWVNLSAGKIKQMELDVLGDILVALTKIGAFLFLAVDGQVQVQVRALFGAGR